MKNFEAYRAAVSYLEGLIEPARRHFLRRGKNQKDLRAKRMAYFMQQLGNPQQGLKIIHVSGTAGKGTVASMLHAVLTEAGKKAGLYTSPHLTTGIERIKVGHRFIAPKDFAGLVEKIKPLVERSKKESPFGPFSYREAYVAMAFLYFAAQKCAWVVLEVGSGGTSDATNFIENTKAAIITNVGYDHTEILGQTLAAIAADKAGIIKKGSRFYTFEQRPRILNIFQNRCRALAAQFNFVKRETSHNYQDLNKKLAMTVACDLGIGKSTVKKALANFSLPGRFEILQRKPLVIVDGAHNELKMKSTLYNLEKLAFRKLHLIVPEPRRKILRKSLALILPKADYVYRVRADLKNGQEALRAALGRAAAEDLVLITGTMYLAGSLRKKWYPESHILQKRRSR